MSALASLLNEADVLGSAIDALYSAASNTGSNQAFGESVSISDDGLSLVVGTPGYGISPTPSGESSLPGGYLYSAGAFNVYKRTATNAAWTVLNQNVYYGGQVFSTSTPTQSTCGAFIKDQTSNYYYNNAQIGRNGHAKTCPLHGDLFGHSIKIPVCVRFQGMRYLGHGP